ncbi:MAG TPA: RraA family protein, partial [Thermomicrobiales bacterium]|nr:RraA family protein [Thermomicrobiales bacterium]
MIFNSPERIKALTPQNPFDRMDDGRPRVPDDLLDRLKLVTNDEAWGVLERGHNYHYQFEGDWNVHLHPEIPLVGRAVTAAYVPLRPDLNDVVQGIGGSEGRSGGQNTWIIDQLQPGDVLVVDLFGKVEDGTFIGDNLGTAARARTGTGMIIDGGIRDLERVYELPDFNVFCRGVHPSAIWEVSLVEVNGPIRIG